MKLSNWLKVALGLAFVGALVFVAGLEETLGAIANANPLLLLSAFLLQPLAMMLRFSRWHFLLRGTGISAPFWDTSKMYAKGWFFGAFTPSRAGELVRFHYLRDRLKVPLGKAVLLTATDRLFDLLVILALAALGILTIHGLGVDFLITVFFFYFVLAGIVLVAYSRRAYGLFSFLVSKTAKFTGLQVDSSREGLEKGVKAPLQDLLAKPVVLLVTFGLTLLAWLVLAFQAVLIFAALGVSADLFFTLAALAIGGVAALIPVTLSGLGTRDAAFILVFASIGIPAHAALSMSIIEFVFGQVVPGLVGWLAIVGDSK
jgi:uncharacterized protein (TIRG00374 family)